MLRAALHALHPDQSAHFVSSDYNPKNTKRAIMVMSTAATISYHGIPDEAVDVGAAALTDDAG